MRFAVFVERHIALNAELQLCFVVAHSEFYRVEHRFALLAYSVGSLELISVHNILVFIKIVLRFAVRKGQAYRRRAQHGRSYYNFLFAAFLRNSVFSEPVIQNNRYYRKADINGNSRYKNYILGCINNFIHSQRSRFFEQKTDIVNERIYRGLRISAGNQSCSEQQIRYAYREQRFLQTFSVCKHHRKGHDQYNREARYNFKYAGAAL